MTYTTTSTNTSTSLSSSGDGVFLPRIAGENGHPTVQVDGKKLKLERTRSWTRRGGHHTAKAAAGEHGSRHAPGQVIYRCASNTVSISPSNLPAIIAGIQRGRIAVRYRQPLADLVTRAVKAAEGRRQSVLVRTQEDSRRMRQAVRDTGTHLLAERPGLSLYEAQIIAHKRLRTLGKSVSLPIILDELLTLNYFGSETTRQTPRKYFRDITKQARYRKLIAMRDGEGT